MTGLPPGPELFAHNRRILADRLTWPAGSVEVCERIDETHPGWHTSWRHGFGDHPAGYWSYHKTDRTEDHLHGATPEELVAEIERHRCQRPRGIWT